MVLGAMLAAGLVIAVPAAGQRLPHVARTYMIGAVAAGETNVVVAGRNVPVYRTGAWATLVDVTPGTNVVCVAGSNHWFVVAQPAPKKTGRKPPKTYEKLPYAADCPIARPAGRRTPTVWLDPGHGGSDAGALSPHGWCEKDANLLLAEDVRVALVRRGIRVRMTRATDCALPLYGRPKAAHASGADAFVALHHNAPPLDRDPNRARYFAIYAWNDLGAGLASALAKRAAGALSPGLATKGALRANYAVTRSPQVPSCLVEADFITHPAGEEAVWCAPVRQRLAEALAQGVVEFLAAQRQSSQRSSP